MPYIDKNERVLLDEHERLPLNPGELNYVITKTIVKYMRGRNVNYALLNEIVGVLESAKAEFQRCVVAPYEDTKMKANGEVYE